MNCNLKDTVGWQVDIGTVISTRAIFIAELSTGKAMEIEDRRLADAAWVDEESLCVRLLGIHAMHLFPWS